eukprot:Awhi_evm1s1244
MAPPSPLHAAAKSGNVEEILKALEKKGVDVDDQDGNDWSALAIAAKNGRSAAVECLLEQGADINAPCNMGQTALHAATGAGQLETMQILLSKNAKSTENYHGRTPIHMAAQKNKLEAMELLLKYFSSDINAIDDKSETALHMAATRNNKDLFIMLLKAGANHLLQNDDYSTPFQLFDDEEVETACRAAKDLYCVSEQLAKFNLLDDYILVQRADNLEVVQDTSGLIEAKVVKIGRGIISKAQTAADSSALYIPMAVKPGDKIFLDEYNTNFKQFRLDGDMYQLYTERDVIAVYE